MTKKIASVLEKSSLGEYIRRIQRRSRGGGKTIKKTSKTKSFSFAPIISNLKRIVPAISNQSKLIFILSVTIILILIHGYQYFKINFDSYYSETDAPAIYNPDNINTVIYSVEKDDNNYKYIKSIAVIIKRDDAIKIIEISPYFASPSHNQISLRTFLNEYSGEGLALYELNNAVSSLIGLRIDRYLYLDTKVFETNILSFDRNLYNSAYENKDFLKQSYTENYAEFNKNLLDKNSSAISLYKLLWNNNALNPYIKTNMGRNELIRFLTDFRTDKQILTRSIGVNQARVAEDSLKALKFLPDYIIIDESLLGFTDNLLVVAEQAELEIYNASAVVGQASLFAREFANIGMNVVKYGNYFEQEDNTVLYLNSEEDLVKFKNSIQSIRQSLRTDVEIKIGEYPYNRTGDIILVLNK